MLVSNTAPSPSKTPIGSLASTLVHERLLEHTSVLFVRSLPPDRGQNDTEVYAEKDDIEEDQCTETIDAGKNFGG